jgi:hypothetical protein
MLEMTDPELSPYQARFQLQMAQNAVRQTGESATSLARNLLLETGQSQRPSWLAGDRDSLGHMLFFEHEALRAVESPFLNPEHRPDLRDLLATYHGALPYAEAERRWLHRTHDEVFEQRHKDFREGRSTTKPGQPIDAVAEVRKAEGEIVSAGKIEQVNGRELLRRWRTWRRASGEFEGQGTLDIAYSSLHKIGELLCSPGVQLSSPQLPRG